jgi:NAD(P)-dependent dehydrogenase (short-subunit alcohol dehydrogenase family)
MIDLKGHAVLVTGSSKGVGRAIAEACAAAGADVVLNGRSLGGDAREAVEVCRSHGVSTAFVPGDLSAPTEQVVESVFEATIRAMPHTDILINNAGQYFDLPFEQMTLDRFEKTMRLNVTSGYFLTQRFARHWIAEKTAGRVLFTGSVNGRLAEVDSTAYDTSKGAVEMMVKTLAVALAPRNIRVNGMAPGLVRTPQTDWVDSQPAKAQWIAHHTPNRQIPPASACGAGAVYLVSDAAYHVHGHMLMIDGGISAWQHPDPM